jgi:hypothetical protein
MTQQEGDMWVSFAIPKTRQAQKIPVSSEVGRTREDAEKRILLAISPKQK